MNMIVNLETTHYLGNGIANHYQSIGEIPTMMSNIHHYLSKDSKSEIDLGINKMLFKDFIQKYMASLEIPYKPNEKRKYPQSVWAGLHKSLVVNQLQEYSRTETITSLINSVYGGDDLGGLTIDNVIDMWLETMNSAVNQIVGSALSNSKINKLFEDLVTKREVDCSDWHNDVEKELVDKGVEIPTHTHTVQSIDVTDENREQFDKFVNLVLQSFDSETYGELPEEYSEARASDIEAMMSKLENLMGDIPDVASSSIKPSDDRSDFV